MSLRDFMVIESHANNDEYVLVDACVRKNDFITPVAKIPVYVLADYFSRQELTAAEANRIVDRNIQALGRIITAKHSRNETVPNHPYVILTKADLDVGGETLTDSVADMEMSWGNRSGYL